MKKYKKAAEIAGLCVLLIAVLVGGIWFLNRDGPSREDAAPSGDPSDAANPTGATVHGDALSSQQFHRIRVLERRTEETPKETAKLYAPFVYQGKTCLFSYPPDKNHIQIVTAADGEVVTEYEFAAFPENLDGLCLDNQENLWGLFWNEHGEISLAQCGTSVTQEDMQKIWQMPRENHSVEGFWVWENYALLHCLDWETGESTVIWYDINTKQTESGTTMEFPFTCLDNQGYLYVLLGRGTQKLSKYDIASKNKQWTKSLHLTQPWAICWGGDDVLYVLDADYEQSMILRQISASTGELLEERLDLAGDLDTPVDFYSYLNPNIGIFVSVCDDRVTICQAGQATERAPYERMILTLEPYTVEVKQEDIVTLTITAPYAPEGMQKSIRMYQMKHPEVQIEWDTQYLSREEFQADALNYKDQIAVRTTAGDVGDLQMITGATLSQDVITDTDAFTDLTTYLESSPIKDQLEWNFLEPLRDGGGAIRAVPLGVASVTMVYNIELLRELGDPIDPNTVTWSELLDLALQWKQEGKNLSLTVTNPGLESSRQEKLLNFILLSNLYGEDTMNQPEFRTLLEKLKELWGSSQLVGNTEYRWGIDGFERTLFDYYSTSENYTWMMSELSAFAMDSREVQTAPLPWGETYKGRQCYGFCWGIPSGSENKELAWDLLEFMLSENGMVNNTYEEGTDPINNVAYETRYRNSVSLIGQDVGKFNQQLKALRLLPISRYDEPYGWVDAVYNPILEYLNGTKTLDEAIELAASNWERYLLS